MNADEVYAWLVESVRGMGEELEDYDERPNRREVRLYFADGHWIDVSVAEGS